MNPLRALAARFAPPCDQLHWTSLTDRELLMRHTGTPECRIPEHADALRQLGRTISQRDEARALADYWTRRALRAEAMLDHPSASPSPPAPAPNPVTEPSAWGKLETAGGRETPAA